MRFAGRTFATVLAAVVVVSAAPAHAGVPIPPGPGALLVPHFVGEPATARAVDSFDVPQHPHLAPTGTNSMHNDAYATDAYQGRGPLGRDLEVTSQTYGIQECATVTFDAEGRIVALCGGLLKRQLKLLDPVTLDVLATQRLPASTPELGKNPLEAVCGGAYFYTDDAGRAVVATTNKQVRTFSHDADSFAEVDRVDLAGKLPGDDCLIALLPDWSGLTWFVTKQGGIGTLGPERGAVEMLRLDGESITNSFAVDETGGVYIVSTHAMYRLHAGKDGAPVVDWRREYDRGTRKKPGQLGQGSGTTPGIARVRATDGGCETVWVSNEVAPTSVPKASLASGLLYVYSKPANEIGIDTWYFTTLDLRTGETVYKRLTGTGVQWNNHYAAIYLGPDGSAYIATIAGMVRLSDKRTTEVH